MHSFLQPILNPRSFTKDPNLFLNAFSLLLYFPLLLLLLLQIWFHSILLHLLHQELNKVINQLKQKIIKRNKKKRISQPWIFDEARCGDDIQYEGNALVQFTEKSSTDYAIISPYLRCIYPPSLKLNEFNWTIPLVTSKSMNPAEN